VNRRIVAGLLVVALVAAAGASLLALRGGGDDPYERYCAEVEAQRGSLGEVLADGGTAALLEALPIFRLLEQKAPEDLVDEWATVTSHLERLADELDAAGVDPATYDREDPPDGVTKAERQAIDDAATALGSPVMQAALAGVQQHARDVCKTPLVL